MTKLLEHEHHPPFRINLSLKVDDHGRTLYYSILNAFSYTVVVLVFFHGGI